MENQNAAGEARGSAAISEELFGRPSEVSREALKHLLSIVRTNGVQLEGWWTRGTPAIDAVEGVMRVKTDVAGEVFRQLLTAPVRLKVKGFPIGLVHPELIHVVFSTPGHSRIIRRGSAT
jgi:hypothetical protein